MEEKNSMPINVLPTINYVGGAQLITGEEEFILALISGNQMERFAFSPKHLKRLSLLLAQQVSEYEAKFGFLATELPMASKITTEKRKIGFEVEE